MLKFVLVGCGRISARHAQLLGSEAIEGASLIGVCDIKSENARKVGEKYNVPHFTDMHEMMEKLQPDVVTVLTESGNHAKHTVDLAPYGAHIVVEKPMALTLEDADSMIRECDNYGVKLFVVKQNRFNLPVRKLREALESGAFGKITMGTVRVRWCRRQSYYDQDAWRGTWAQDGGVLANQASHHVDLLEWMMGEPESVFAKTNNALASIEAEDTACVLIKFKSGALGIIEATTATRPKDLEGSISILGENGSVEIGGFAVNEMKTWNFENEKKETKFLEDYSVNPPNVYGFGHQEYYNHVVSAINNQGPNLVDGLEGRKSLELITSIYESAETGKEVMLRFKPVKAKLGRK